LAVSIDAPAGARQRDGMGSTGSDTTWDYIIVGGGSAGCVLAARLSEDPGRRVLLLDAGRPDNHPYNRVPAGQMPAFTRPDMNWLYQAEPDPTLEGRVNLWPAGKVLGGGSAINGMMYVRGHRLDYQHWAELGCSGWDYAGVLPYFRRLEANEAGGNAFRGADGPQGVSMVRIEHPLNHAFVAAAQAIGIPFNPDLNGELAEGVGYCQATQRNGLRHSTARAYLHPARGRANLRIVHHAEVTRVLLEGRVARGVAGTRGGAAFEFRARRGVILSAGAIASPKLLLLSGIGAGAELARHGIALRHELPGVGRNLQEHAVAGLGVRFRGIGTLTSELGPLAALRHGLDFLFRRRGALTTAIGHVHALARTREGLATPNVQIIFAPSDFELTDKGAVPCREPRATLGVGLCHARSFGEVRLRSADPAAAPVIDHRLLAAAEDRRDLVEGCRLARQLVQAEPFARHVECELEPGPRTQSDEDWERYLRANAGLMYHPCGTCRMGRGEDAVVDPELRVRGLDGLWVADASIIPAIPAGNINASCIMIGEKAADLVRAATA
jgi:choline dehydrogenase